MGSGFMYAHWESQEQDADLSGRQACSSKTTLPVVVVTAVIALYHWLEQEDIGPVVLEQQVALQQYSVCYGCAAWPTAPPETTRSAAAAAASWQPASTGCHGKAAAAAQLVVNGGAGSLRGC